eukprot:TRINITY_DN11013_c0_g2_i3.p1 TRINITY_DN11013_c0_g2~~TRINITY_DN11013_c0_g2_i3.p1  ORF type:complete len:531 (+),score=183.03 TRINITY_DN11013_c0_g2_i3:48-1595(+)
MGKFTQDPRLSVADMSMAVVKVGSAEEHAAEERLSLVSKGRSCDDMQHAGGCLKARIVMSILLMTGIGNVYTMRANLSAAVVPMQKEYGWSNATQGIVLSSFFWGYILFQIPGALLSAKYGGKQVFGLGILGTAVTTLLLPLVASRLWLLLVLRAVMGLCESVTYPAMNALFTTWVPSTERSLHVSMGNAGAYLGTAIAFPISGIIIDIHKDADDVSTTWPWVFYVFGILGCVWFVLWEIFAASSPEQSRWITEDEVAYISATRGQDADVRVKKNDVPKSASPPWISFLLSVPAWAIYINHFANNFCVYTLMTYLPKYMDEVLGFNLSESGGIAVIPYILQFILMLCSGVCADHLIKTKLTVRSTRLLIELVAFAVCCTGLVLAGWMTDVTIAVVMVTIAIGFSGFTGGGFMSNYIDVSPHYAGHLFSVGNLIANVSGIIAPILAGLLLGNDDDTTVVHASFPGGFGNSTDSDSSGSHVPASHWRNVFYVSAGMYVFAGIIWIFFMVGKPVPELN